HGADRRGLRQPGLRPAGNTGGRALAGVGHSLPARGQLPPGGLGGDPPVPGGGKLPVCAGAPPAQNRRLVRKRLEGVPPAETPLSRKYPPAKPGVSRETGKAAAAAAVSACRKSPIRGQPAAEAGPSAPVC